MGFANLTNRQGIRAHFLRKSNYPDQKHVLTLKKPIRNRHLFVADFFSVIAATFIAFLVRFEEPQWISDNLRLVLIYLAFSVPLRLVIFFLAGMYRRLWRHASVGELRPILVGALGGGVACAVIGLGLLSVTNLTATRVPFSVVFIDFLLTGALIALPRLMARIGRRGYMRRQIGRASCRERV